MNFLKQLIKSKTVKNAGWLICGRIIQMAINFFVGIYTTRFLGPSNFGLINYASAYTGFFASVCTLGINSVIVKELVNNREKEGEILIAQSKLLRRFAKIKEMEEGIREVSKGKDQKKLTCVKIRRR